VVGSPQGLIAMPLAFSTKAGTLAALQGVLKMARIAPLRAFSVADWQADRQACLTGVLEGLGTAPWIVRSSCGREDSAESSNAGAFLSIPNVDETGLETAVEQVIASYGEAHATDEVLIQPMLSQVVRSGVAFSHDPNTCAPYRVVNWSEGNDTTDVTGGMGGQVWQQAANSAVLPAPTFVSSWLSALLPHLSPNAAVERACAKTAQAAHYYVMRHREPQLNGKAPLKD
jgi:hypothetical protein